MLSWLYERLYQAIPVEFGSAYPLMESVRRLQAEIDQAPQVGEWQVAGFGVPEEALGEVAVKRVWIRRNLVGPRQNLFCPVFAGEFRMKGGKVLLTGSFSLPAWAQLLASIWLLCAITLTVVALLLALLGGGLPIGSTLAGPMMLLLGYIFLVVGRWTSSGDKDWISQLITRALT